MHQRVIQWCFRGLFDDDSTETTLFGLLDCICELCSEEVNLEDCDEKIEELINAVVAFETSFKKLMVSWSKLSCFCMNYCVIATILFDLSLVYCLK